MAAVQQTPKQRATGLQRPSFSHISTVSSPSLRASTTDINRKASLQALTGQVPMTPARMDGDLEVGDAVNVPGDMFGTVKFVGSVRGKAGQFVGVELATQFAARGKNNGDVDGVQYFETLIPGAGIFLPVHRAERRSPSSADGFPTTPTRIGGAVSKTPAIRPTMSQSVGPGARPPSPSFKAKRPSLPRPESPLRRQPPALAPTPARGLSQSVMGSRPSIGQTPSKPAFKSSTSGIPPIPASTATTARPYSRNGSRLGHRNDTIDEDSVVGRGMAFSQTMRSPSRQGTAAGAQEEIQRLRAELTERDRRLNEQASSLAEMEQSVKELSALMPADGMRSPIAGEDDDKTATQLRQMLREKNDKISKLTAEFDNHRADFRSTLDSLEMASTETERVYEEQKRDLLAQIADMQVQMNDLQDGHDPGQSREDFEGVALQLKGLEELVAELEEGLEESRRGEAEARGEVEFLRGEVERGRSELRREREKAAAAMKHASMTSSGSSGKDIEQRDDEIRGLKAIIHSLSEASNPSNTNARSSNNNEEIKRLQKALDDMRHEKETLENEVEQLHRDRANINGTHARNESELTEKALSNGRSRSNTVKPTSLMPERLQIGKNKQQQASTPQQQSGGNAVEPVYCEMCESADHDTLDCGQLNNVHPQAAQQGAGLKLHKMANDLGKENQHSGTHDSSQSNGITTASDADKWCALCEKDGHLAFDCPEEQY